jgi:hypothetical protein
MESNKTSLYRTSDLYFASFLCCVEFPLKTTEKTKTEEGGTKVVFVFSLSEQEVSRAKALYFGGTGAVKARVFVDHLRSLKQMCYILYMLCFVSAMCFM